MHPRDAKHKVLVMVRWLIVLSNLPKEPEVIDTQPVRAYQSAIRELIAQNTLWRENNKLTMIVARNLIWKITKHIQYKTYISLRCDKGV